MNKTLFIGKTGSGKTTLCQRLHGEQIEYQKTQAVDYYENAVDTPGEFLENPVFYKALIVSAQDVDVIVLVQDCTQEESLYPPLFGSMFTKPILGIVTKTDLAQDLDQINQAKEQLEEAGAEKVFEISTVKDEGIEEFTDFLERI
ncbi:EutP/PduV family microcompartment system protein [Pontibacillus litoralis]|uniref:Ethanolamine utilization protein EutP n=1 Tax=Pontibacillus litoralis JSM 072002 TaxID=1385512 RepID=A0A0A5G0C7_9BACI|nr:EutP/PduV family microcompartment system protein [Pontibacillus litoralis]KGX84500.1 ethanolamine utilization protein EutP [Pontibacillus litoralis JSM 072002]